MPTEPRFRISVKQTSKNLFQIDGTVEHNNYTYKRSTNPEDAGITVSDPLGMMLWSMIEEAEKEGRKRGRKFVGDEDKTS